MLDIVAREQREYLVADPLAQDRKFLDQAFDQPRPVAVHIDADANRRRHPVRAAHRRKARRRARQKHVLEPTLEVGEVRHQPAPPRARAWPWRVRRAAARTAAPTRPTRPGPAPARTR